MKTRLILSAILLGAGALLGAGLFSSQVSASPEPSLVYGGWEFNFTAEKPRPIQVINADGKPVWYWYVTYKVVNNTGADRMFVPEFAVSTDEGDIIPGGKDVPPSVYEAVRQDTGNKLIVSPSRALGIMLLGEDNARESVVVWKAFDHDVTDVNLFIQGLSGESQTVKNPETGKDVNLHKALMISYSFPGTNVNPASQPVEVVKKKWVMR
jgi:hypothetical protein